MSTPGRIVIYHTSDIHAHEGFGDRLASIVEPGALLVDCGDALSGSSVFFVSEKKISRELKRAPYAALAVGNREFHYLHRLFLARAHELPAPLVCSNLIDLRNRESVYQRELMLDSGGTQVRILSLLVPQYRTGSGWEKIFGWRFLSPDAALVEMLGIADVNGPKGPLLQGPLLQDPLLQDPLRQIPTVILSHLGLAEDRKIAARWPGLAAILGGHTHELLAQPEMVNQIPIAHPGAYASHVGRLELAVENGTTRLVAYELLPLR